MCAEETDATSREASSAIWPSRMLIKRCAWLATSTACVTQMNVRWWSRLSCNMRSMIPWPVLLSSAPVGSSVQTRAGCVARARAIATRCRCPPESSAGRWRHPIEQSDLFESDQGTLASLFCAHPTDEQR